MFSKIITICSNLGSYRMRNETDADRREILEKASRIAGYSGKAVNVYSDTDFLFTVVQANDGSLKTVLRMAK